MNGKTIGYWLTTGLFSAALAGSAIMYLTANPMMVEAVHEGLGYPLHVLPLLGLAKALGVVALMAPGFARLKEWAYAGFTFNLLGASWAHLSVGDGAGEIVAPLVLLGILIGSYVLRPEGRRPSLAA